jgi:hypothetical protein
MATNHDDFDVLKFFITVMVLLTVIVAGFAIMLQTQVSDLTRRVKVENDTLKKMDELANDAQFREWIARDREGRNVAHGSSADFKALLSVNAGKHGLKVENTTEQSGQDMGNGMRELRFQVRMLGFRLEPFMRFLVSVEQEWPGAKVREITELTLDEKNQLWNGMVVLAIFKPNA